MGLALMTRVLHRTALWRPNQAAKARSAEEEVVRKKGWVWQERRLWRERRVCVWHERHVWKERRAELNQAAKAHRKFRTSSCT
eukprot:scaffold106240_cov19-Tisochrysis_lutea.AAC.4